MSKIEFIALWVVTYLLAAAMIAVTSLFIAIPVFFLWNWLMPSIFGIKLITFWQAYGITLLSGLLFGRLYNTKTTTEEK